MYTDRHVHTCIHAHTENARGGYWCEWLSRGQGRDWGINWGSLFHTGESIKCHVTAMPWGVTGKQYPKCAERKAAESKKEREIKAQWRGGGGRSAVCRPLISSLQLPPNPPRFRPLSPSIVHAAIPDPIQKARWGAKAIMALHCLLLSCCFTLGLVLPGRDGIPAFLSLWCLIRACSWSWVSVTALSPLLCTHTHFCPLDTIHWQ